MRFLSVADKARIAATEEALFALHGRYLRHPLFVAAAIASDPELAMQILREEKVHFIATGKYIRDRQFVFALATTLADTPEEFTELCGKKLGMQRELSKEERDSCRC